jgi:hypothetical protein
MNNHFEGLILSTIAALVITISLIQFFTAACAYTYSLLAVLWRASLRTQGSSHRGALLSGPLA